MSTSLADLGLLDLLEADPRPTFVVALPEADHIFSASSSSSHAATVVYNNPAISDGSALLETLLSTSDQKQAAFWAWISTGRDASAKTQRTFVFENHAWTRAVVQGKWVVVSRNESAAGNTEHRMSPYIPVDPNSYFSPHHRQKANSRPQTPGSVPGQYYNQTFSSDKAPSATRVSSDISLKLPDLPLDHEPFLDVVESVNWAGTPLGPMDQWHPLLQQTFGQILCNSQPTAIYWGDQFITVYNEAFGKLLGSRHPALLGRPMGEVFPEMAPQIRDLMDASVKKQRASNQDETRFFVELNQGPPLETYLKWSIVPLFEKDKRLGFTHPISETTLYQMFRRRTKILVNMGEVLNTAKDVRSFWSKLIEELAACQPSYEIPLAILYSISKDTRPRDARPSKFDCDRICRLEGALGAPRGHPVAPNFLHLGEAEDGLSTQFRRAMGHRKPFLISVADGTLPKHLLDGIKWRGFGDPCDVAIVIPIRPTKEEEEMGLLVLGLNPRRPYDDAYKLYIKLLNQKLATSLACTVLLEEERRRGRNAAEQAAYDQAMLKEKLAYQTQETIEYTRLFQVVSEFVPNGFAIGDHQGNITFANSLWYRIIGYPEGPPSTEAFFSCVESDDRFKIRKAYEQLKYTDEVEFEFRIRETDPRHGMQGVKSPFDSPNIDLGSVSDKDSRHFMAQAKAERAGDGTIIRTFTCLTDVTGHRRTTEAAMQRAQEAGNLKRMAELATVGMFDMDISGRLLGANNVFFELCGIPKVNSLEVEVRPWETSVVEEDLPLLRESLSLLARDATPQVAEIRLKTTWIAQDKAGNNITAPRWVNATFMPVRNSDGIVSSFTGCLSDVSLPKWQLELETERKEEAIESKRQQDNFIDMTSHEMRNPLSAIIHCSDAIIASLAMAQEIVARLPTESTVKFKSTLPHTTAEDREDGTSNGDRQEISQFLGDSIDNAETIVACAQHQKRIVDDILTMSKLDSKLLAVTPCTVSPVQIAQEALKMFDVEARRTDIDLSMTVHKSFTELGYDYLDLDSSRVKQVLINLLTNALKFTKSGSTRNVAVSMKASLQRPSDETSTVTFIPRSCSEEAEYEQPALERRSNPIYLMFEVKDTGQGLNDEEKASLFNRFVQASSRTHLTYGGSGLGLFISRRLTELQKGAIGVASAPGMGSTFAFFIEAYVPSEESRLEAEAETAAARASISGPSSSSTNAAAKSRTPSVSHRSKKITRDRRDLQADGILIVEDNLINQQITRRGLHDKGFTVDVANHGLEALEKLEQSVALRQDDGTAATTSAAGKSKDGKVPIEVNLILMDIEMPVQDGLTCTRRIRELESEGHTFAANGDRIPIIAVSANARVEQVQQAKAAGCDDVLVKPYRMPELIEKMHVVARRMAGGTGLGGQDTPPKF